MHVLLNSWKQVTISNGPSINTPAKQDIPAGWVAEGQKKMRYCYRINKSKHFAAVQKQLKSFQCYSSQS